MNNGAKLIECKQFGDERGKLVVIEGGETIAFDIKRMFCVFDTDRNTIRGQHANRKSEFVMICVTGGCKVQVIYQDGTEETFSLDRPDKGLYIPKNTWKNMYDFSENAVLVVLSNEHYDSQEYIRDINDFKVNKTDV